MEYNYIKSIIQEELKEAEARIVARIRDLNNQELLAEDEVYNSATKIILPDNKNYEIALEMYLDGKTHSAIARKLGVSINAVKKYYNWLVKHGYLPTENAELSDVELKVVDYIFNKKMSLRDTAKELNCSITNIAYRRDSALRKGYTVNSHQ